MLWHIMSSQLSKSHRLPLSTPEELNDHLLRAIGPSLNNQYPYSALGPGVGLSRPRLERYSLKESYNEVRRLYNMTTICRGSQRRRTCVNQSYVYSVKDSGLHIYKTKYYPSKVVNWYQGLKHMKGDSVDTPIEPMHWVLSPLTLSLRIELTSAADCKHVYKDCIASLVRFLKLSLHLSICLQPFNAFRITVCRKAYSQYNWVSPWFLTTTCAFPDLWSRYNKGGILIKYIK